MLHIYIFILSICPSKSFPVFNRRRALGGGLKEFCYHFEKLSPESHQKSLTRLITSPEVAAFVNNSADRRLN